METVAEDVPLDFYPCIGSPDSGVRPLSPVSRASPSQRSSGVRGAVKAELACLFGCRDQFRELVHKEVIRALEDYHNDLFQKDQKAQASPMPRQISENESHSSADSQLEGSFNLPKAPWVRQLSPMSVQSARSEMACQHFTEVALSSNSITGKEGIQEESSNQKSDTLTSNISRRFTTHFDRLSNAMTRWQDKELSWPFGGLVTSQAFESTIRFVIALNCAFLVYVTNEDIKEWDSPTGPTDVAVVAGEACFMVVYIVELMLKLAAYRLYFFCDRQNCLDCILVIVDIWDMTFKLLYSDTLSAGYLRTFRLLKLGKALRALQVVRAFEKLKAFLICIHGSVSSLFWSVVMLNVILYMFSLCIVQLIAMHFREEGELLAPEVRREFELLYGSVQASMVTLFQLSTAGRDWKDSYALISQTGWTGSAIFLAFVSFTHIAVINIITGIFVESAMQNLTPDRDSLALDHQLKEQQAAKELEELFRVADKGCSGYVSKDDLDMLVAAGRLPRLLSLMGLQVQHAGHLFKLLSASSTDGRVSYSSFVRGCMKLKGSATSFDLHMLQVDVHAMQGSIRQITDLHLQTKKATMGM